VCWYVAQVITGKEQRIMDALRRAEYRALAPSKIMRERVHGEWRERERRLFPGYVFAYCSMTPEDYYAITATPHVIRLLGSGKPEPVTEDEAERLLQIGGDGTPLGASDVRIDNGRITVLSGPLMGCEGAISQIDRRQRRAVVELTVARHMQHVTLAIKIICATCALVSVPSGSNLPLPIPIISSLLNADSV
jgi:transcriptional antiterminator NusG